MLVWEPRSDGIGSSVPIRSVTSPSGVHSSTFPLRKTTRSALATPAGASRPLVSADQVRGIAVSSWLRNSNHTSFVSASLMRAPARRSLGGARLSWVIPSTQRAAGATWRSNQNEDTCQIFCCWKVTSGPRQIRGHPGLS